MDAHINMIAALELTGKENEALLYAIETLQRAPDSRRVLYALGHLFETATFLENNTTVVKVAIQILESGISARPESIFNATASLLKNDPTFKRVFLLHEDHEKSYPTEEIMSSLSRIPLLLIMMKTSLMKDKVLEKFLKKIRSMFLLDILKIKSQNNLRIKS